MIPKISHMQVITRDAGEAFADEVRRQLAAGMRIVTSDPDCVVLEEPEGRVHPANGGHWRGLARRLFRQRRTVTIAMRRPVDEEEPTTALPNRPGAPPSAYGAVWQ